MPTGDIAWQYVCVWGTGMIITLVVICTVALLTLVFRL